MRYSTTFKGHNAALRLAVAMPSNASSRMPTIRYENKLKPNKGGNVFSWSMHYPAAKKFDGMVLWWASLQGAVAKTGAHKVALNVNGKSQTKEFRIVKAPDSEGTDKDIESQLEFIKSVNDKVSEAHQAITDIRSMRSQVKDYAARTGDKEVTAMAEKIVR